MTSFESWLSSKVGVLQVGRLHSLNNGKHLPNLEKASMVVPLLATSALRVTGADRIDFVHGQVSNDVKRLQVGEYCDTLLLNYKGHALAQMRILRRQDDLLLFVEGGAGEYVRKELEAHIIFDQVELEALNWMILSLQGSQSSNIIEQVLGIESPQGKDFSSINFKGNDVFVSFSKRSVQGGFDLVTEESCMVALVEVLLEADATLAGEDVLNLARVTAGIPHAEFEGGEGVLPQEAGLEPLISYTKGCYLGQEIMARIEARGNLRRSLQGLSLNTMPSPDMRDIQLNGKKVGRLGTVVEHPDLGIIALAILRDDIDPAATLSIGEAFGKLESLPFKSTPIPTS